MGLSSPSPTSTRRRPSSTRRSIEGSRRCRPFCSAILPTFPKTTPSLSPASPSSAALVAFLGKGRLGVKGAVTAGSERGSHSPGWRPFTIPATGCGSARRTPSRPPDTDPSVVSCLAKEGLTVVTRSAPTTPAFRKLAWPHHSSAASGSRCRSPTPATVAVSASGPKIP